MTRDKLIAQADRLEGVRGTIVLHDMDQAAIIAHLDALIEPIRALAAQQPEAVEPVGIRNCPAHFGMGEIPCTKPECANGCVALHPQASAPADHTAADAPNREGGVANVEQCAAVDSAVGVTPDLDALVEDLMNMAINSKNYGRSNDGAYFEKAAQAITDLWAQLADKDAVQGTFESYAQIVAEHSANITRLEAENAELEKKAKNANADADIYAKAWQRELGRWMGNKRHHIDACVLGTQTLVADNAKARELLSMMLRWQEIGLSQFDLSEQSATGTRLAVVRAFLAKQGDTP